MKHVAITSTQIVDAYVIMAIIVASTVSVHGKSTWTMQADVANNEINDKYPSRPINVCLDRKPLPGQRINGRKTKVLLGQFVIHLKHVAAVAENEMNVLTQRKRCDITPRHYQNQGLKTLNPRRSKKNNRKLKIPKHRKGQLLYETLWWLTSMHKAAHEVSHFNKLRDNSTLLREIEKISYAGQNMLHSMKIGVPYKSSLCYREQTMNYPLKPRDYTKECAYAFVTLRDIQCALKHLASVLGECKIVVKGRRRNKTATLRCKHAKSVFFSKRKHRGKNGCRRRRRLGTWSKLRL